MALKTLLSLPPQEHQTFIALSACSPRRIPMAKKTSLGSLQTGTERARSILHQHSREIQPYGKIAKLPIALDEDICAASVENLNQFLADTITLRDLYKKHHWQVVG